MARLSYRELAEINILTAEAQMNEYERYTKKDPQGNYRMCLHAAETNLLKVNNLNQLITDGELDTSKQKKRLKRLVLIVN